MIGQIFLPNAEVATRFAQLCAQHLQAGDCVLLHGPIGAGKSHFARAVIHSHLGPLAEVPSPTFTLVQVYQAAFEIWHADLYRLTSPYDLVEIGLDAAFGQALCLIEWPDRLGDMAPPGALHIAFAYQGDEGRMVQITGARGTLAAALARAYAP